jgi:hypothetical protein
LIFLIQNPEKRQQDYNFYYQNLRELGIDHNHVRANYETYIIDLDLRNTVGHREIGEATCSSFKEIADLSVKRSYEALESHIKFNRMKRHKQLDKRFNGYTKADFSFRKRMLPPVTEETQSVSEHSRNTSEYGHPQITPLKMPAVDNSAPGVFGFSEPTQMVGPFCDLSTAKKKINQRLFDSEHSFND